MSEHLGLPPPRALGLAANRIALQPETYVDVRDHVGKWLGAQVLNVESSQLPVRAQFHYLDWDSKWDEWIDLSQQAFRIAEFRKYSSTEPVPHNFQVKQWVRVYHMKRVPYRWTAGFIRKIDVNQAQVEYQLENKVYQYWYHVQTDEIAHFDDDLNAARGFPARSAASFVEDWMLGEGLEVQDVSTGQFYPATALERSGSQLLIHFAEWTTIPDEWLDVTSVVDRQRMRRAGSGRGASTKAFAAAPASNVFARPAPVPAQSVVSSSRASRGATASHVSAVAPQPRQYNTAPSMSKAPTSAGAPPTWPREAFANQVESTLDPVFGNPPLHSSYARGTSAADLRNDHIGGASGGLQENIASLFERLRIRPDDAVPFAQNDIEIVQDLMDLTESDLAELLPKLGSRRRLQKYLADLREVANGGHARSLQPSPVNPATVSTLSPASLSSDPTDATAFQLRHGDDDDGIDDVLLHIGSAADLGRPDDDPEGAAGLDLDDETALNRAASKYLSQGLQLYGKKDLSSLPSFPMDFMESQLPFQAKRNTTGTNHKASRSFGSSQEFAALVQTGKMESSETGALESNSSLTKDRVERLESQPAAFKPVL